MFSTRPQNGIWTDQLVNMQALIATSNLRHLLEVLFLELLDRRAHMWRLLLRVECITLKVLDCRPLALV